ncbi:hypothetical protein KJ966_04495 [bacterium]|nr:hypothetical protein [bacterium]
MIFQSIIKSRQVLGLLDSNPPAMVGFESFFARYFEEEGYLVKNRPAAIYTLKSSSFSTL